MMNKFLTVEEAAEVLRCNPRSVYDALRAGKLRGSKPFGAWLISPADVEEFVTGRATAPPETGAVPVASVAVADLAAQKAEPLDAAGVDRGRVAPALPEVKPLLQPAPGVSRPTVSPKQQTPQEAGEQSATTPGGRPLSLNALRKQAAQRAKRR